MDSNKIVTFEIDTLSLENEWFSYLNDKEKSEIKKDIENGISHTVKVVIDGLAFFGAVIDVFPDKQIHVREVGGSFPQHIQWLEVYCHALGRFYNAQKLTVCSTRKGVEFLAKKLEFKFNSELEEFEKEIDHGR